MRTLPLLVLLVASPAFAQSRVYTNADLGRPLSPARVSVSPDVFSGIVARQFVAPAAPTRELGPSVLVLQSDPNWPFRTSTVDAINKPLFEPWSMTTYVGHGHGFSHGARGHVRSTVPTDGIHLVYGR